MLCVCDIIWDNYYHSYGYTHSFINTYILDAPTMYLLPGNILPYKEVIDCGQAKDIKVELFHSQTVSRNACTPTSNCPM